MINPAATPSPDAPPPRFRNLRRSIAAVAILVVGVVAICLMAATRVPEAFRGPSFADRAGADDAARRFVTGLSALHAAFIREGAWEAAFAEDDINCWLATDLRRNHRDALPESISDLRVDFRPRQVAVFTRVAAAGMRPVAVVVFGVRLREPNQLGVTVEQASLGAIPLPGGPILAEARRRFDRLGMVTSVRQLDGRSVLVVYIPSTHESGGPSHWLESLSIADGSMAVAGRTLVRGETEAR